MSDAVAEAVPDEDSAEAFTEEDSAEAFTETEQVPGNGAASGHHAVDEAVRSVHNASGLSAQEQLAAYEAAHRTLREVLSSIEE